MSLARGCRPITKSQSISSSSSLSLLALSFPHHPHRDHASSGLPAHHQVSITITIMIFFNISITIIAFFVTKSISSPSSPSSWLPTSITLSLNHHHYYHNHHYHHHHYHHPHYPHRHHGFTTRPGDCCPSSWDCSLWEARKSNNSMCFFSRSITKRSNRWWFIFCLSSSSHSSLCNQSALSNQLPQSNVSKLKTVFFIIFNVLAQERMPCIVSTGAVGGNEWNGSKICKTRCGRWSAPQLNIQPGVIVHRPLIMRGCIKNSQKLDEHRFGASQVPRSLI